MNEHETQPRVLAGGLRILLAVGLGAVLAGACDFGPEQGPCDDMCPGGPFASVEENSNADGVLTCTCDAAPSQAACASYCEEMGGDVDNAAVQGDSCVCPPA